MFKKLISGATLAIFAYSASVAAEKSQDLLTSAVQPAAVAAQPASLDAKALKAKFTQKLGLEVETVAATPLAGIAEVVTNQGLFYASYDGAYLFQGKLYSIANEPKDLTEASMAKVRVAGMNKFANDMIVYPAKNEKHVVTVFTDITCGYCRKLHEQMDEYNDIGITVRYLAYPRAGIVDRNGNPTRGFQDLRSVWCSEDPNTAMNKAKAGSGVTHRICDKPIEEEFDFGRRVGVNGTPAIMLADGTMLPGYRQPKDLLQVLESL
ncbi:bifunctional protein-disulfide isomerase/oxidoreductase DsbC [Thalassomonas viridans]|uniref:Thiol:disulfide interchange protein n=1 Tax=Thalassomonas viridans TaxID=137584 RepID=A0AAE9Z6V1_9GAMM|nr:bifunctional protein-disulfide isomerase/oxidoreductase DsbC [Thalassomonas viridans]WDE06353.1 bifunctional protein-disulfide isomerase/oxidoreductase DsbC [Thalassomonas viridans]